RPAYPREIEAGVQKILDDVRREGDAALTRYAREFDHVDLSPDRFRVRDEEFPTRDAIDTQWREAIEHAHQNIVDFSRQHLPAAWNFSPRRGVSLGEKYVPYQRVGAYIPGGSAPLVSTVLHTVTLAKVAGVPEIVVVTPPGKHGQVHPAILYAAQVAGATEVYRLGGVYAIGALAYGTPTVRAVEKIVGPGNAYITAAKKIVYGQVAIDMVAGPSEVLIIADETANPAFIAADFLSQIEHGSGREQAVLVTPSRHFLECVQKELERQTATLARKDAIRHCLETSAVLILVDDLETAVAVANAYAPEHLEVQTANPRAVAEGLVCAGAIFLGPWTPEPVGDFTAGPSHVLPTGGAARCFSGLTVDQFYRRISLLEYNRDALLAELPHLQAFADMEQLQAHGNSAAIRQTNP
ncbi:MAG: histidinol dehydrogenase, partial [Lentisphaerae bacterium]